VPLGRRVEPDEVAAGVVWLALDSPAYIAAERLNLSGGMDRDWHAWPFGTTRPKRPTSPP
jgi:NAD(P)-dependent dehydrogenase (short-subunit alcohol dehydrogenase family)